MNSVILNIFSKTDKIEEMHSFYEHALGFLPASIGYKLFTNPSYPNLSLNIRAKKGMGQKQENYISLVVEKNLPSICKNINDAGYDASITTDMCETEYSVSIIDPSGSVIIISSKTLGTVFKTPHNFSLPEREVLEQ